MIVILILLGFVPYLWVGYVTVSKHEQHFYEHMAKRRIKAVS